MKLAWNRFSVPGILLQSVRELSRDPAISRVGFRGIFRGLPMWDPAASRNVPSRWDLSPFASVKMSLIPRFLFPKWRGRSKSSGTLGRSRRHVERNGLSGEAEGCSRVPNIMLPWEGAGPHTGSPGIPRDPMGLPTGCRSNAQYCSSGPSIE